jgi:phosphatidylglycerophosphate synthase
VSPNAISVAGMLACLAAGTAMVWTAYAPSGTAARAAWIVAAVLVQLRLLANMLDGMVAIRRGVASPVGELYNEVPDRVSDVAALIGLGYAAGGHAALGWAAALAAVFTAYVRAMGKIAGAPQDFGGPMAKPQRMAVVTATALYMGLAPAAWRPDWAWGGVPAGLPAAALAVILAGSVLTAVLRLRRTATVLRNGAWGNRRDAMNAKETAK